MFAAHRVISNAITCIFETIIYVLVVALNFQQLMLNLIRNIWLSYQNQAEIEKFKSEEVEMASQRKALLKNLEDSLSSSTEQADLYDTQYKQSKKILEQLKSGPFPLSLIIII